MVQLSSLPVARHQAHALAAVAPVHAAGGQCAPPFLDALLTGARHSSPSWLASWPSPAPVPVSLYTTAPPNAGGPTLPRAVIPSGEAATRVLRVASNICIAHCSYFGLAGKGTQAGHRWGAGGRPGEATGQEGGVAGPYHGLRRQGGLTLPRQTATLPPASVHHCLVSATTLSDTTFVTHFSGRPRVGCCPRQPGG